MTNALSIAIPALALFAILATPKQPRWTRQPWFTKAHPTAATSQPSPHSYSSPPSSTPPHKQAPTEKSGLER
jgi:hypothetical protein